MFWQKAAVQSKALSLRKSANNYNKVFTYIINAAKQQLNAIG